jgi:hypothetical protein
MDTARRVHQGNRGRLQRRERSSGALNYYYLQAAESGEVRPDHDRRET